MATATLVTRTPHRLRYLVAAQVNDSNTVITFPNASLLSDALGCQPIYDILKTPVATQDEARQVLLGVGTGAAVFNPYITGERHCRVRALLRDFATGDIYLGVDANASSGAVVMLVKVTGVGGGANWYLDLEVEYSTSQ